MEIKPEDVTVHVLHTGSGFGQSTAGVKLVHRPTGLEVSCDANHSQHRNKAEAWERLQELVAKSAVAAPLDRDEFIELVSQVLNTVGTNRKLEVSTLSGWPGYNTFARAVAAALDDHITWAPRTLKVGDRCEIVAGFSVGAFGTIVFIEPGGDIWLQREHASSPTKHVVTELKLDE